MKVICGLWFFCIILENAAILRMFLISADWRSSRPEVFCKKGVLRNFAKFTGKHLCQSLFLIKLQASRPPTLSKKRLWHRCFPVNFAKFLRSPFYIEHLWWLLLWFYTSFKLRLNHFYDLVHIFQTYLTLLLCHKWIFFICASATWFFFIHPKTYWHTVVVLFLQPR